MEINATILVSTISFICFIFIMNAILYKPVMEIMAKRQSYIDDNKQDAAENHKKANILIEDKNTRVADAQRKSRDIVASKADAIKEEKSKIINDVKQNTSLYFDEQKQSLAVQKDELSHQMKGDVADLANRLTTKLMGVGVSFQPLNEQDLDRVIDEVMRKNA